MKKILALLVVAGIGVGAYVHYHQWSQQSNTIKAQIEEIAAGKDARYKITYDKIQTGGYPLRHEVVLDNPCFYFLSGDLETPPSVADSCLKGKMSLSYHPFSSQKSLFIETDGETTITVPQENEADTKPMVINGKLTQEYKFEDGFDLANSGDAIEVLENLKTASLKATNLSVKSLGGAPQEYIENFTGTLDYTRKLKDAESQELHLALDYQTRLGNSIQAYQHDLFNNLNSELKAFNQKSGVNTISYDITTVIPSWVIIKDVISKINNNDYNYFDLPNVSIKANQKNKNNFLSGYGDLDFAWSRLPNRSFELKLQNKGVQDLTKEGEVEFVTILQQAAHEVIKSMVASTTNDAAAGQKVDATQYDNVFNGFPRHLEFDLDLNANRNFDAQDKEHYKVALNQLSFKSNKGALDFVLHYDNEKPFNGKVEFESLVRIVDGIITRYNIVADNLNGGKEIPVISEKERDTLLAILQRYSDSPEKLQKNATFTIQESDDGVIYIGNKQDIRGMVGELAFFFQHLKQKVVPSQAK